MPPTTIPRSAQIHTSVLNAPSNPAADTISLREFVVDEDAENFNSALWRTIDQNAFILAQRDALEAFNVAKALRLSKETAAAELERRQAVAVTAPTSETRLPSSPSSSRHRSQPIAIKKSGASPHLPAVPSPSTSPIKPLKISSSYQDKKAPASIAKQKSRNHLSLSTSPFSSSPSSPPTAVDSRHLRSTSQSNTFTKVPSLVLHSNPPVSDQRSPPKREPVITEDPTGSSPSSFQTSDVTNAKRRRTGHGPSGSFPSPDMVVAAPPMSSPQKSSTFSRNLRPGTIIPPTKDNSPPPSMSTSEGSKSLPPIPPLPPPPPKQKAYLHDPFSDAHLCPQCGNRLSTPRIQLSTPLNSRSLCDALHTTCSSCMTRHCRGCTSISPCTRSCPTSQELTSCAVRNCCYNVRAVVIFEALNIFDHIFATEAGFAAPTANGVDPDPDHFGRQQREAYIKLLISKADKSMRKFEDAFERTLKVICSWLQVSPPEDGFDADDETSPAFENPSYLNDSIPQLLLASYLPEVIHTFLSNNNVRDWLAHSDTYIMILEFLRWISDFPTLSSVLNRSLPSVQRKCTLRQWATGQGTINLLWYSSHAKNPVLEAEPIGDLIKKLETHRSGLRAFAAKVQFEATLDKVNALCDGISYLLLQQVVGGF